MPIRVAINGFGRIGRNVLRSVQASDDSGIENAALNDLTDNETPGPLLQYDTVHRVFPGTLTASVAGLEVDGRAIEVLSERDPAALP